MVKIKHKKSSCLAIVLLVFFSCKTVDKSLKVSWVKSQPLTWNDFKGNPQTSGYSAFLTYNLEIKKELNEIYTVTAVMDKSLSFKKIQTDDLLKHEQYHFNISEVFARKFRKYVVEKKLTYSDKEFRPSLLKTIQEMNVEQKNYDDETEHSLNKNKQLEWQQKIDILLKQLEPYETLFIEK